MRERPWATKESIIERAPSLKWRLSKQVMCGDYGFRSGTGKMYEDTDGSIPANIYELVSPLAEASESRSQPLPAAPALPCSAQLPQIPCMPLPYPLSLGLPVPGSAGGALCSLILRGFALPGPRQLQQRARCPQGRHRREGGIEGQRCDGGCTDPPIDFVAFWDSASLSLCVAYICSCGAS